MIDISWIVFVMVYLLQNQHLRYVNGGYSQNLDITTKEEKEKSQGALAYKQSKQKKIKND